MDPYSTHLPFLVEAALITARLYPKLPMLELGCGDYSTPVLRVIAQETGRELDVIATDVSWGKKLGATLIPTWEGWRPVREYGFCLLDNELLVRDRFCMLPVLGPMCRVVVFHDARTALLGGHTWSEVKEWYTAVKEDIGSHPGTAILYRELSPRVTHRLDYWGGGWQSGNAADC